MAAEIGTDVSDWLQQNVTPAGSMTMVDNSLTISDAAADAKAVGDALTSLNGSLENIDDKFTKSTELHLNTISGYISSGGAFADAGQTSEVTTSWVSVKTGDVIIANVQYNNSHSGWGCVSLRGINYEWIKRTTKSSDTSDTWFYEYVVENDGYVAISYRTYDDVLDAKYYIIRCATNYQISDISRHGNNIGNIYKNYDGGINSNGNINQNENTYHTEFITVDKNAIISYVVDSRHLNVDDIYVAMALYDHNKTFIKRVNISTGEIKTTFFNGTIAIKDIEGYENIKYVSVIHKHDANSFFGISFIATELQKIEPKYKANFKKSPIRSINHRGYNTVAPENTIPAFKKSKEMGFNIVETDIRQTSDGVFVLLHDAKINRTARNSDGTALSSDISIIDITYEQALTYDFGIWKGSEYAGAKIPTLNEFLDLCRNINLSVYLEIESSDIYTENDINSVLEMIKRKGMREKVTIICSNLDVLTIIKDIDPAWRIGFIKSSSSTVTLEQISSLKTGYNEVFVNAQQGIVDNTLSDDCYNYGLELECWVPDTESSVIAKAQYVTGITSDFLVAEKVLYNYYMNMD